jgi:hypothetical protein
MIGYTAGMEQTTKEENIKKEIRAKLENKKTIQMANRKRF